MVNGTSMEGVLHSFAVQQLRKSGKVAAIVSMGFTSSFAYVAFCFYVWKKMPLASEHLMELCNNGPASYSAWFFRALGG